MRDCTSTWRLHGNVVLFLLLGLVVTHSGVATALAAVATAAALCWASRAILLAVCARPVSAARVRTALRDRQRRTAFLPQRDPDAAGRPRPRAPGLLVPTAA
ncbi:DUF6412 domain-containing protein [Streptomyces sp. NPDC059740]|uniref:DUF6412 domain-containing protein n=1 Tax=Streptomyces sp. NPDC059740 TaxID=3346926 RepID=UPI003656C296